MVEARLKGDIRLIPQDQADELDLPYDEATRKPAGSFHLRIWGGRRKGSGSYYTPQEITAFLVKDALAPLVEPIIAGCAQRNEDGKPVRRADEILHIKVCDPAMGSGPFWCRRAATWVRHTGERLLRKSSAKIHVSAHPSWQSTNVEWQKNVYME